MLELMMAVDAAIRTNTVDVEGNDGLIRIGEMVKKHGVTLRALRFYEAKGLLAPRREGGARVYTLRDNARLRFILLGRRIGFSLRDVKQIIDLFDAPGSNAEQLEHVLRKSEKQLARLQHLQITVEKALGDLNVLTQAIRNMSSAGSPCRDHYLT
jgi:DNA-binding transcriptional MerR regulator